LSEEIKEVIDYKKIIGITVVAVVVGIIGVYAVFGWPSDFELPDLKSSMEEIRNTEKTTNVRNEYKQYFDKGITEDDILDIQDLDCMMFEDEDLISKDPKYTEIFNQRRAECGK